MLASNVINMCRAIQNGYTQTLILIGQMNHLANGTTNAVLGAKLGMDPNDAAQLYAEMLLYVAQMNTVGDEPGAQLMFRVVG